MKALFAGLKNWHVVRIAIAYLVVAWLVLQLINNVVVPLRLPNWTAAMVIVLLAIGFPIALVLAWAFRHAPGGAKYGVTVSEAIPSEVADVRDSAAQLTGTSESHASNTLRNSVAVLPFENLSPKPEDAYFAAGLHEEILNRLAHVAALNVIARTSVMRYANETKSAPDIARELNVQTVMEGSVRFANGRVRVTTQLIDGETNLHLWSETYDHPFDDVFAIESDIAVNVANALRARLSPEEKSRMSKAPTDSPEAYALYLRALDANDHGSAATGLALLQRAIELDPGFARAYALLALIEMYKTLNTAWLSAAPPEERTATEARARRNAERAIELDPAVPYAHVALATPAVLAWRWTEVERDLAHALETAPNDEIAQRAYARLLSVLGRHDEAIAVGKHAVELNPNDPNAGWYAMQLGAAGRYAEAAQVLERKVASAPTDSLVRLWLAFMEIARENPRAAIAQLEISEQLAGDNRLLVFLPEWAYAYGRAGQVDSAQRIFEEIQAAADNGGLPGAGGWAMAYLAIGDRKQTLQWLEKAAWKAANHQPDEGHNSLLNLKLNVTNDPVLRQPEFVSVLRRIKGD